MPAIDNETLLKEYYDTVKDKFPLIDYEAFVRVCRAPFKYFKNQMECDDTPLINIKYLGRLIVFPQRVRTLLKENQADLHFNKIDQEEFEKRKATLEAKLIEITNDHRKQNKKVIQE